MASLFTRNSWDAPASSACRRKSLYGAQVFVLPTTNGVKAGSERAVKMRYFKKLAVLLKGLKD